MKNLGPVLTICTVKAMDSAVQAHIFPFIASFLLSIGIIPSKVANWSGVAEGSMAIGNLITIPLWIWLFDRFPHRLLLIWSLLVLVIVCSIFGLSTQLWQVILLRALPGLLEKAGLLTNIMGGSVADQDDVAQVFGWLGAAAFWGDSIGTFIGGQLAEPHGRIPILGDWELLVRKPYLLPGLVLAAVSAMTALCVMYYIPSEKRLDQPSEEEQPFLDSQEETPFSYWELARNGAFLRLVLINFLQKGACAGALSLIATAGHLPISLGGIGLPISTLSHLMSSTQILSGLVLTFLFHPLSNRLPNSHLTTLTAFAWLLSAMYFPLGNRFGWWTMGIWVVARPLGMLWWGASQTFLAAMFPETKSRTKAVSIYHMSTQFSWIIGPTSFGHMVHIVTISIAIITCAISWGFPQVTGSVAEATESPQAGEGEDEEQEGAPPIR